jgi:catechol 2,3-dioxygenase-like lactoylglutathione lyase family enzyme
VLRVLELRRHQRLLVGRVPVLGFHHVQLAMPAGREDEAVSFYAGVLGLDEVPKPPDLVGRGGAWFRSGSVELHLGVEEGFVPATKAHPALLVDDLAAMEGRLRAAGVEPVADVGLEGHRRVYVSDPFGNRLELIERG